MSTLLHPSSPSSVRCGPGAGRAWPMIGGLALGHMLIDGTSIYAATRLAAAAPQDALWIMAAYNFVAFAPQAALGWIVDRLQGSAPAAALGAALVVGAALLGPWAPLAAIVLAGLGNALYHVGAGSLCLQLARGQAALAGVFVGPGGIGVILGTFMGSGWWPGAAVLIAACALLALWVALARAPAAGEIPPRYGVPWVAGVLLLLAVAARQLVGGAVNGSWFAQPGAWILIACAATTGKMALGFVADRCGWMRTGAGLAALAAPLVAASSGHLGMSVAGAILTQAAMPVTLAGLSRLLPRHPALAFGVASSAIWLGGLPAHLLPNPIGPGILLGVQLGAAGAIAAALWLMRQEPAPGGRAGI